MGGGGCLRPLKPIISENCGYADKTRARDDYSISGFTEHLSCLFDANFNFSNIWHHGVKHPISNSIPTWSIFLFFVLVFFHKKALPYSILLVSTSIGLTYFAPFMRSLKLMFGVGGMQTLAPKVAQLSLEEIYKFFIMSGFYLFSSKILRVKDTNFLQIATITGIGFELQESFHYLKIVPRMACNFQLIIRFSLMHMWYTRIHAHYSSTPTLLGLFLSIFFHFASNYILSNENFIYYFSQSTQLTAISGIFVFRLILIVFMNICIFIAHILTW